MKISEKEKVLLFIVGTILIIALYFQFVFLKQRNNVVDLEKQKDEVKNKYETTMKIVNSIDDTQLKLVDLNSEIGTKTRLLYPSIIQEKIILELDNIIRKSNVTANLKFSEISVKKIDYAKVEERKQGENILQTYKDQYSGNSTDSTSNSNDTTNTTDNSKDEENNLNVEQINVKLDYTGTYKELSDFINKIEQHSRENKRIVMTNLTGNQSNKGVLSGTFELNFYSVPKIGEGSDDYFKYALNSVVSGKPDPFDAVIPSATSSSNENSTPTPQQDTVTAKNDFLIVARPSKSDLSTLSIRYALDTKIDSTIFSDNEGIEDAEITITKENGKYYYKYKTSSSSYPKDYENNKVEFIPQGNDIIILAMSSLRLDENDKSGANIKVINNSGKAVKFYIKNEDPSRPRITLINGNNGNVVATKSN
ncbi:MAG: hypothetical protein AB6733_22955 [Clostridiaceae bacterium]